MLLFASMFELHLDWSALATDYFILFTLGKPTKLIALFIIPELM